MPHTLDPSRDLLFGLLALQTGLINQAQLVAAFHAWTQARDRPMAEILAAQGALETPCLTLVEGLVIEHLRRHGSDPEQSLAAIGVGESTRECLARIGDAELEASLAHVGSGSTDADPDRTASYAVGTATSDGLRFRVLRPHAHGGLGAIFVALDTELHREVALKQILDSHADDEDSRRRFLVEAEITGGLEHPGIVPVYGLGTYGDGRPYYAMRFIRGDSLKEAIERFHADAVLGTDPGKRSLKLHKLLRRFTDVCNAIDYAHTRGVLHRDIKPGNVVVGKHGETLVVDWGLAKATGKADPDSGERTLRPASASGSAETLPGSALGTPAYMSPEQAQGDLQHLGPRSDVYSLGATLYYLLTGKPPFAGDAVDVIPRVQRGDFRPPRAIDPSIDRALEAVCRKAMALRPEDRYGSCRALVEDIERWMADEPVSAYGEPLSARARRWARHHRTGVAGAAAALLAGLIGLAAVAAVQSSANGRLRTANVALESANRRVTQANADLEAANAREKQRFDLALEAIRLFHGRVGDDLVLKADQFKPLRDQLLRGAADFYNKLEGLLKGQPDRASREALGDAYAELGVLESTIGDQTAALAAGRKALAVRRELASRPDADTRSRRAVAESLIRTATALSATGHPNDALARYKEAATLLESLPLAGPGSARSRSLLGLAYGVMGNLLLRMGKSAEGLSTQQKGLAIAQKLADENPGDTALLGAADASAHDVALGLQTLGQTRQALAMFERARTMSETLRRLAGEVPRHRFSLASDYHSIGELQWRTGKAADAMESYRQAHGLFQKLADDNPAVIAYQSRLANNLNSIGYLHARRGRHAEALTWYRRALAIYERLAAGDPKAHSHRSQLAHTHHIIGMLLSETGEFGESLESCRRALAIQQRLAEENPGLPEFREALAISYKTLGNLHDATGRLAEALVAYRQAAAIQQKLVDDNPEVEGLRSALAYSLDRTATVLWKTGKRGEALESHRRAQAHHQKLVDDNPTFVEYRHGLAHNFLNVGGMQEGAGLTLEALESYRRAQAHFQKLVDDNPGTTEYYGDLADSLLSLGRTQQREGRTPEGAASFRRAIVAMDRTPAGDPVVLYNLARRRSLLAGAAAAPASDLTAAEGRAEADRAMDALRRAAASGFRDLARMRSDPDLDPLRARDDFRLLMMDLAMPAMPFAPESP